MEGTQIFDLMGELKLYGMKAAFDEIMATAVKRQHEPQRIVDDLASERILTKGIPFAKPHRSSTGGVHSRLGCGGRSSTTARTSTNAWHSAAEQEVSPTMACQRSSPTCSPPSSFRSTRPILCLSSVSGSLTGKPVLRWKVRRCHSRNSRRVHQLLTAVRPASGRRSGGPMLNDGGLGSRRRFQQMANVPVRTG